MKQLVNKYTFITLLGKICYVCNASAHKSQKQKQPAVRNGILLLITRLWEEFGPGICSRFLFRCGSVDKEAQHL